MTAKYRPLLQPINISASLLNQSIVNMWVEEANLKSGRLNTPYFTQFDLINKVFKGDHFVNLRPEDIATRLSMIDLFYTTNFNRFSEFGLEELTEIIWNLCCEKSGHHSDSELVKKVEYFVSECYNNPNNARESELNNCLFTSSAKFGIVKVADKPIGYTAQSLVSKYLFFLLETHHSQGNTLGFPIYDSIANDLQKPLLKRLNRRTMTENDMVGYVGGMKTLLDCLINDSPSDNHVWQMPSLACNTQFGLLDYFLWRIGKSGLFSFSLLWTKEEKQKHYIIAEKLKHKTTDNFQEDFRSLPLRFQEWNNVYNAIKSNTIK